MGRTVGVALERDGGHGDDRTTGEPFLELVVFSLAFGQPQPPAIVMKSDGDVIRVVEGRCAAIEGGVVEVPLRRGNPPDELRKVAPVHVVAGPAALGGEVELVPPLELGLRRQGQLAGSLAADQVAAHGHESRAAFGRERRDGLFLGPVRGRDASTKVLQSLIRNVDVEWTDVDGGLDGANDDLRCWWGRRSTQ